MTVKPDTIIEATRVVHWGLRWRHGDESFVKLIPLISTDPDTLPTDWVGDHAGHVYDTPGGPSLATVDIVVTVVDDKLQILITVNSPEAVPPESHIWDARQTSGTGAGLMRFAPAPVYVEPTKS